MRGLMTDSLFLNSGRLEHAAFTAARDKIRA
jgi:hypothetical protein